MIEKLVELQKAYERKKEKSNLNSREWNKKIYMEKKKQKICIDCCNELSKKEKKMKLVRCWRCRHKNRKKKMKAN